MAASDVANYWHIFSKSLLFFYKFMGLIVGLIYLRLDYDQKNLQNFAGLLFFLVTNLSFSSLQSVIFVSTLLYRWSLANFKILS